MSASASANNNNNNGSAAAAGQTRGQSARSNASQVSSIASLLGSKASGKGHGAFRQAVAPNNNNVKKGDAAVSTHGAHNNNIQRGGGAQQQSSQHRHGSRTANLRDSCRGLLQELRGELVVDTRWHLPFPSVPASQLLYVPESVRDTFACPTREILHSDIDAMQIGILERLHVLMPPDNPHEMRRVCDAVAEAEAEYHRSVAEAKALGLAVDPVPPLTERYRNLDQEDADLVAEDLGVKPLDDESLPSAALLKHHIYTELGRTPIEARAEARLSAAFARIAQNAQQREHAAANEAAQAAARLHSIRGGVLTTSRSQTAQHGQQHGSSQAAQTPDERWTQQINRSFQNAKALDNIFGSFTERAAETLLGLKMVDMATARAAAAEGDNFAGARYRDAKEALQSFAQFFIDIVAAAQEKSPAFAKDLTAQLRRIVSGDSSADEANAMLHERWSTITTTTTTADNNNNNNDDDDDDDDPFSMTGAGRSEKKNRASREEINIVRREMMPRARTLLAEWQDLTAAHDLSALLRPASECTVISLDNSNSRGIDLHLQSLLRDANPANSRHAIALANPQNPTDTPVAVLPILSMDTNHMTDAPFELRNLQARVFLGVAQHEEARAEQQRRHLPAVLFGEGELLLRPDPLVLAAAARKSSNNNNNSSSKDDALTMMDPAQYIPESSKFEKFKEDSNADGLYLLKVGRDAARFARIPRVMEYRRATGTEMPTSALAKNMVIWDDEENDDAMNNTTDDNNITHDNGITQTHYQNTTNKNAAHERKQRVEELVADDDENDGEIGLFDTALN